MGGYMKVTSVSASVLLGQGKAHVMISRSVHQSRYCRIVT